MQIYRDPNIAIEVSAGQRFAIALEANLSTAFTWSPENYDKTKVKIIEKTINRSSDLRPENTLMIGEGTEQIFEVKALKPGKFRIMMQYKREWDKASKSRRIYIVNIKPAN